MSREDLDWSTWREIVDLTLDFWDVVDGRADVPVERIFSPDVLFAAGGMTFDGHDGIRAFLEMRRESQPDRVSRHIATNQRLWLEADGSVSGRLVVSVFAEVGAAPVASGAPRSISDVTDRYQQGPSGWRIARRQIQTLFVG